MEDKKIDLGNMHISQKRVEFLMEEILYQLLKNRLNKEEADKEFEHALSVVQKSLEKYYATLPPL